jgi:hypothetical protein
MANETTKTHDQKQNLRTYGHPALVFAKSKKPAAYMRSLGTKLTCDSARQCHDSYNHMEISVNIIHDKHAFMTRSRQLQPYGNQALATSSLMQPGSSNVTTNNPAALLGLFTPTMQWAIFVNFSSVNGKVTFKAVSSLLDSLVVIRPYTW